MAQISIKTRYQTLCERIEKQRENPMLLWRLLILCKDRLWFFSIQMPIMLLHVLKQHLTPSRLVQPARQERPIGTPSRVLYVYDTKDWAIHNVGRLWLDSQQSIRVTYKAVEEVTPQALYEFDIIWFGYLWLYQSFIAKVMQSETRTLDYDRFIVSVHDPLELFPQTKDWKRQSRSHYSKRQFAALRDVRYIVTASVELETILKKHGLSCYRIPTTSSLPFREIASIKHNTQHVVRITSVFNTYPRKNFPLLERIMDSFSDSKEIIFNLKQGKTVLSEEDYTALLDSHDIYVCTSYQEGGPIPAMDAMKRGLVVLTTPVGQMPEIITDGYNGFICHTHQEFVARIRYLKDNPDMLQTMRERSLATFASLSRDKVIHTSVSRLLYDRGIIDPATQTVSLLFMTHNQFERIDDALRSYLPLLDRDDVREMIILDNASTDERTRQYLTRLSEYPKVQVIFSGINHGLIQGRTLLFERAQGDIIFSLDSDATLHDTAFIDMAKRIACDERIGICGPVGSFFISPDLTKQIDINHDSKYEGPIHFISGCCQIFRRELLTDIVLDSSFYPCWYEDVDLSFTIKDLGKRVYRFDPQGMFEHSWGKSWSPDSSERERNRKYLLRKWQDYISQFSLVID